MNKRIIAILLCFVMVFAIMVTAVPVFASSTETAVVELIVTPSKTEASPGDTITYTVSIGPVKRLQSVNFTLVIPEGLIYGVGKEVDGLKELLGADKAEYTDSTKTMVIGGGGSYNSEGTTPLMTFTCKVNDGTVGKNLKIGIMDDWDIADDEWETYPNVNINTDASAITIVAAPKPATGISLNKTKTTIYTGNTETLIATVEPADSTDTVAWSSNKTDVAKVDSTGKVSAIAPGTATITAKAGGKTATCVVTVENAPCTHVNKSTVAAKDSTCKEKGWDEYKKCDDCEKLFNMSDIAIDEIPYRPFANHTGGTATCKSLAICDICAKPYGDYASHNYIDKNSIDSAIKDKGTCKDKTVYYYSCIVCGKVEKNKDHTFEGDKNPTNHVGGTYKKNQKEATCKDEGYSGDIYCYSCDVKLESGTVISKTGHNSALVWSHDENKHWKECTNAAACGVKLNEGKHTSTGDNVATCKHKAVCDVCKVQYGGLADHNYKTKWSSDNLNHWHECEDCGDKIDLELHTPDHIGSATEDYAIKCIDCGYVIEAKLPHTHVFDNEVVEDYYLATKANCKAQATYYKSCDCGAKGTETFKYGDFGNHIEGTIWEKSVDNHWHICTVNECGIVIESSKAAHSFKWVTDKKATATEKGSKHEECEICGFEKESVEIPATGIVTEPTDSEKTDNKQEPLKTGDNSTMILWLTLLLISGFSIVGITVNFKRKEVLTK